MPQNPKTPLKYYIIKLQILKKIITLNIKWKMLILSYFLLEVVIKDFNEEIEICLIKLELKKIKDIIF